MNKNQIHRLPGYQLLSLMGKKVLRPGGKELTRKLISALAFSTQDDVIEFAPGTGWTAERVLACQPHTYKGIDLSEEAVKALGEKFEGENKTFILGNVSNVDLPDASADKLYGEALLTMHAQQRKEKIIREAHRLLKKGGLYGIHELSLAPDTLSAEYKRGIQKTLAKTMHVNARPLTLPEWKEVLEKEGFRVKSAFRHPMAMLDTRRVVADEGLLGALRIGWKVYTHPAARKRISRIRKVFQQYEKEMKAIVIIAEKR